MEDIKQDITDNQNEIIMDSLIEIKNGKVGTNTRVYNQEEFDEMSKIIVKLSREKDFEYTEDENETTFISVSVIII